MNAEYDELTAKTLKIVDHEGNLRIRMNGGREDYPASIIMYNSADHPGLQILNLPDGRIAISLITEQTADSTFRSTSLKENGLLVDDYQGRPAILIGAHPGDDHYSLSVFKDGEEIFETPVDFGSNKHPTETEQETDD